jgi:hypothetical protein
MRRAGSCAKPPARLTCRPAFALAAAARCRPAQRQRGKTRPRAEAAPPSSAAPRHTMLICAFSSELPQRNWSRVSRHGGARSGVRALHPFAGGAPAPCTHVRAKGPVALSDAPCKGPCVQDEAGCRTRCRRGCVQPHVTWCRILAILAEPGEIDLVLRLSGPACAGSHSPRPACLSRIHPPRERLQ